MSRSWRRTRFSRRRRESSSRCELLLCRGLQDRQNRLRPRLLLMRASRTAQSGGSNLGRFACQGHRRSAPPRRSERPVRGQTDSPIQFAAHLGIHRFERSDMPIERVFLDEAPARGGAHLGGERTVSPEPSYRIGQSTAVSGLDG